MSVTTGDILAAIDVVRELLNECDELPIDVALAMHDSLGQLLSEAKNADAMLTTAVKRHLEDGVKQIGDRVYGLKPTGKSRYHHDDIGKRVVLQAMFAGGDPVNGVVGSVQDVAEEAVRLMLALYVSPADQPKAGGLEELGVTRKEVSDWENTGKKIVITDLGAPEGSE